MFPTAIKGHLIDAVYIPDTNGAGSLWFQTDDSFYYASTVETGGSLSISTGSLFNKTYTYIYDPVHGKVLQRTLQRATATKARLNQRWRAMIQRSSSGGF
jgi:hypothetical protein